MRTIATRYSIDAEFARAHPVDAEQPYAQAYPHEFQYGLAIGSFILRDEPNADAYQLREALRFEVSEWANANSPDVASPHTIGQETAVGLGAVCQIEIETGVRL